MAFEKYKNKLKGDKIMERLTKKFGDKVILPIIPMGINSKEDLDKYHKVRKEYQDMAIKLAAYEDIGLTPKEIDLLKGCYHAICKEYGINEHNKNIKEE